jgi:hypothetical protein
VRVGTLSAGPRCLSFPGTPLLVPSRSFLAEVGLGIEQAERDEAGRAVVRREPLLQDLPGPICLCKVDNA